MAKHIYDSDGNYKGKILSDEEHRRNKRRGTNGGPFFAGLCLLFLIVGAFMMNWKFGLGLTGFLTIIACYHIFLSSKISAWWKSVDHKKKDIIMKLGVILVIILLILIRQLQNLNIL